MANTKSAKKATRKIGRRTVEEALASGDKAAAQTAFRSAEPILMRTAQKGVVPRRTAQRKVSRLAARVKAMA
jgi:small subunit ribosomal protein S20